MLHVRATLRAMYRRAQAERASAGCLFALCARVR